MDEAPGEGWWKASDGRWYPPEQHPDHVAAAPPPTPPPAPPAPPPVPPPPGVAPGGGLIGDGAPGAGATPVVSDGGSSNRTPMIVLAVLLVVGIGFAVMAVLSGGDDDTSSPVGDGLRPTVDVGDDPGTAPATTRPDVPSTEGTATPSTSPGPTGDGGDRCRYVGVDSFGDMQIEVEATYPGPAASSASITYALNDEDGVRFFSESVYVEAPRPGERLLVQDDTFEEPPVGVDLDAATCTVLQVEEGFGDPPDPAPEDAECRFAGVDFADDVQVTLMVSNPFDTTSDLQVLLALRTGDGTRFATSTAYLEVVAPGEVVRSEEDTVTGLPSGIDGSDVECEVLGVTQG